MQLCPHLQGELEACIICQTKTSLVREKFVYQLAGNVRQKWAQLDNYRNCR